MSSTRFLALALMPLVAVAACEGNGSRQFGRHATSDTAPLQLPMAADDPRSALYASHCAACHSGSAAVRAPGVASFIYMSPRSLLAAMETGNMRPMAESLEPEQRRAIAEWITGRAVVETPLPRSAYCGNRPASGHRDVGWSGWGGEPAATGFRSTEQAGLTADDVAKLELKWVFSFPDATQMRSQPALLDDRVILGSQWGDVYALDRLTGCVLWTFRADSAVRGAISVGRDSAGDQRVYFVDNLTNVHALDVETGALVWKTHVGRHQDATNTGSATLQDGRLYVPISSMEVAAAANPAYECCTSSGAVVAVDAASGQILWSHRVIGEPAREVGLTETGTRILAPSGAPVWSSPTVDARRGLLYVGTGENYTRPTTGSSDAILALELETGTLAWTFQGTASDAYNVACGRLEVDGNCPTPPGPDFDFGMAPILVERAKDGKEVLVVGQKSGMVYGLDPENEGARMWSTRVGSGSTLGGIHWGIASDGVLAYVTNSDHPRSELPAEFIDRGRTPGLFALDLMTGEIEWESPTPADVCGEMRGCVRGHSAAPAVIPGVVFAGSLDGRLRAHSTQSGRVLWDFDTARSFDAVNGVAGRGGAIDGPSPVVGDRWLFVNSGYGLFDQMPGNALLAFSADTP
ncbi:MAG: PQQ-binding-like beta-propeller repeat protein [Deltaproteobacteria bacterium]|nr:PQQ-binding-like beta-propeller repeat protein [Deltaproteobacteria bacterium]